MGTTVKRFQSTDIGAPNTLTNVAGKMIEVLDAVLVNGYNSGSVTSITRSGTTATATRTTHGFLLDDVILNAGANETEYNGLFRVTAVTTNTYTFEVTGTPATPATGTLTSKKASAGWTKEFSGTNKAVYRPPAGNRLYLRIRDDGTVYGYASGFETMSDVDTGTGQFFHTTEATSYWHKSSSSTPSPWDIVVTDRHLYFWVAPTGTVGSAIVHVFADLKSHKSGDAYATLLISGGSTSGSSANRLYVLNADSRSAVDMHILARSYTQVGGKVTLGKSADPRYIGASNMGAGGITYPNPVDGGLYIAPITIGETVANLVRGTLPGCWSPLHSRPVPHASIVDGSGEYLGKKFLAWEMYASAMAFMELSDTWDY